MHTVLQINTSLFSGSGQSTRLADEFVARWKESHPDGRVIVRDLVRDPIPHLTAEAFRGFSVAPGARTPEQRAAVALSDALIDELKRADLIVLGLPMYNFSVPSTLKAYFDYVARAGVTFRYTENGSVGLLGGRRAIVFAARGGIYAGTADDTETRYVEQFLNFIGIAPVTFVHAEGLAIDARTREEGLAQARACTEKLLAQETEAA
ncbi:MAG TPA: FMN-dependent NADH-azoreductase [Burkholderiales bacterium]